MRFPRVFIRLLVIVCIIVLLGVSLQWRTIQQRLPLVTQPRSAPPPATVLLAEQQRTAIPTLPIPDTPDISQWSAASSDATATPSPPLDPHSCGGVSTYICR